MANARIYLDCAEIDKIRDAVSTGLVDGIATNPNKIAKSGKTYRQVLDEIRSVFAGPIAFQSMGRTTERVIAHAKEIHAMDPGLAVKVVADSVGLPAIKPLVAEGVKTNATLIFNPTQALMAGLAGSPFISPFIGRARMTGADGVEAIAQMRELYDAWGIDKTVIIGASIKDVTQVIEVIIAGAHAVAVPFEVFTAMMEHPLTERGFEGFLAEFEEVSKRGKR
ncbi:MAG: fructose-6-phosphate aldolase [Spirochaetaceae bacterium]|nr:MAG: fructose-6-phosphate aldolase [Spirochaetaceae bacterium]